MMFPAKTTTFGMMAEVDTDPTGSLSDALLQECFSLCRSLQEALGAEVLKVSSPKGDVAEFSKFSCKSTIGCMLSGLEIDNMVVGGIGGLRAMLIHNCVQPDARTSCTVTHANCTNRTSLQHKGAGKR